jgi:hypothetical protein
MKTSIFFVVALAAVQLAAAAPSAIIEQWNTSVVIRKENELKIREYYYAKILDEKGYIHAVFRDYYNSFRKINSVRVKIIDANGKKIKELRKGDALDLMLNPSGEVSDSRMLILDPNYKNFPFYVEIESDVTYTSFMDFPSWSPRFAYDLEVKSASLIVECFIGFQYRVKTLNGVLPPVSSMGDGMKKAVWKIENLAAIPKHLNYKTFMAEQPQVHLAPMEFSLDENRGSFQNWADFGEWYLRLNEGRNVLTNSTKTHLMALKNDFPDHAMLVKAVYKYMQSKTRYISIQLGIGGFQAIPADKVEKTGYGDCKALSNYMKAMLDFLQINSNYVLVKAGRDVPEVMADFPSNQFNHVFLAVPFPADTLWLECTSQITPPSHIGTFTDDRNALWVEKGKSLMIHTPVYDENANAKVNQCTVTFNEQGDASASFTVEQRGVFFDEIIAYKYMKADQIGRFNEEKFRFSDFKIESFNYSLVDSIDPMLELKYELKITQAASKAGHLLILPMDFVQSVDDYVDLDLANNKTEIRRGFTLVDRIEVIFPDKFRVSKFPEDFKEEHPFGKTEWTISKQQEGKVSITRKVTIYKGTYSGEAFDAFSKKLARMRTLEGSKIVFVSKT